MSEESAELKLYELLAAWLSKAQDLPKEQANLLRKAFQQLEEEAFGGVDDRVKNPTALLYDRARNALVYYAHESDPARLKQLAQQAAEAFAQITKQEK